MKNHFPPRHALKKNAVLGFGDVPFQEKKTFPTRAQVSQQLKPVYDIRLFSCKVRRHRRFSEILPIGSHKSTSNCINEMSQKRNKLK